MDTVTKITRNSKVWICIVQWSRHGVEEATWEREDALKKEFPHLFRNQPNLFRNAHPHVARGPRPHTLHVPGCWPRRSSLPDPSCRLCSPRHPSTSTVPPPRRSSLHCSSRARTEPSCAARPRHHLSGRLCTPAALVLHHPGDVTAPAAPAPTPLTPPSELAPPAAACPAAPPSPPPPSTYK